VTPARSQSFGYDALLCVISAQQAAAIVSLPISSFVRKP